MSKPREIPTLHVKRIDYTQIGGSHAWVVRATSYGRVEPSGLGEFNTEEEATAAMEKLKKKMAPNQKDDAPDLTEAVWNL